MVVCVLLLSVFAGCGEKLSQDQTLSVRNRNNGKVISLNDTMDTITAITGNTEIDQMDFTDEGIYRTGYQDMPGIYVDYLLEDNKAVAIRLMFEDTWEISSGVRYGMEKAKVEELYKDNTLKEVGAEGGYLFSYDESGNPVAFDEDSAYNLRISFAHPDEDGDGTPDSDELLVNVIALQSNLWRL